MTKKNLLIMCDLFFYHIALTSHILQVCLNVLTCAEGLIVNVKMFKLTVILFFSPFSANREFIEQRRKALRRYLTLIARHPLMHDDKLVQFFLSFSGSVSRNLTPSALNRLGSTPGRVMPKTLKMVVMPSLLLRVAALI